MNAKMISLSLTSDQITAIDQAIGVLENQLHDLISLSIDARRKATKMGEKSEAFCRKAIIAMELNPQIIPPTIGIADVRADLDTLDRMRPFFERLRRLAQRSSDSEFALGSDIKVAALDGYRVFKSLARSRGIERLSRELGGLFAKRPRIAANAAAEPAPGTAPATVHELKIAA